jgi:hypothetical protein
MGTTCPVRLVPNPDRFEVDDDLARISLAF